MNKPLSQSNEDQLASSLFKDFATSGSVLNVISDILPKVNKILEENMIQISESFSEMAGLVRHIEKNENTPEDVKVAMADISARISAAIVGLQFQDRVSQNLVIAENISKFLASEQKESLESSKKLFEERVDQDLLKKILEKITLGEIRNVFITYLINQELIENSNDLCYTMHEQENSEEIELF